MRIEHQMFFKLPGRPDLVTACKVIRTQDHSIEEARLSLLEVMAGHKPGTYDAVYCVSRILDRHLTGPDAIECLYPTD